MEEAFILDTLQLCVGVAIDSTVNATGVGVRDKQTEEGGCRGEVTKGRGVGAVGASKTRVFACRALNVLFHKTVTVPCTFLFREICTDTGKKFTNLICVSGTSSCRA